MYRTKPRISKAGKLYHVYYVQNQVSDEGTMYFRFQDLHALLQGLALESDVNYPPPASGREGLREIVNAMIDEPDWEKLAEEYNLNG